MKNITISILTFVFLLSGSAFRLMEPSPEGIFFRFKGSDFQLQSRTKAPSSRFVARSIEEYSSKADTFSNVLFSERQYVEIIRQDAAFEPNFGIALGFEFDERNGEYPYTPSHAVMQLKNFSYGGVEFSRTDTSNYTGVFNDFSADFRMEIDGFAQDTIFGRFQGVLVSGSGEMQLIENGSFKAHLLRK